MPKKFLFYVDPAHGYLRVPLRLLEELGITKLISNYSMKQPHGYGSWGFLEEDLDAWTFSKAYEKKYGTRPDIVRRHIDHLAGCRRYPRFPRTQEFEAYKENGFTLP